MAIQRKSPHAAFTLVELLVVIAIIGILAGMLMPAVQSAREAGRRATCLNNLSNLGKAVLLHEQQLGHFPSGGWGGTWAGIPNTPTWKSGAGPKQPGGWIYNILPYIEEEVLHDLAPRGDIGEGIAKRYHASKSFLNCPTRRAAALRPLATRPKMADSTTSMAARNDYAINGGALFDHSILDINQGLMMGPDSLENYASYPWPDTSLSNGIAHQRSRVKVANVSDGVSSTYLVAEKLMDSNKYTTGDDPGDNLGAFSGNLDDTIRWTSDAKSQGNGEVLYEPVIARRDRPGGEWAKDGQPDQEYMMRFGSAHSAGFNAVFCDGSGRLISYSVDQFVHQRLGIRNDGEPVDDGAFQ